MSFYEAYFVSKLPRQNKTRGMTVARNIFESNKQGHLNV